MREQNQPSTSAPSAGAVRPRKKLVGSGRREFLEQVGVAATLAVGVLARALVEDAAVPFEPERFKRPQDVLRGSGRLSRRVDVLDPDEPFAAGLAGVYEACDRGDDRA